MAETSPLLDPNEGSSAADHRSFLTRLFRSRREVPSSADSDDDADGTELATLEEEAQERSRAKGHRQRIFECCQEWYQYICLSKWYKWTAYYIPILEWLPSYKCPFPLIGAKLTGIVNYILGDVFAGLTLASISIPMSLSYAAYSLKTLDFY